ncbi:hypothetical protein [Halobellus rufus]|uniref:hypothetical protein n=1 Tax=Halobellus rufus TaxID=1448860 RepID=UPI0006795B40|nr:hypothetical protein [Halobellus rufus]
MTDRFRADGDSRITDGDSRTTDDSETVGDSRNPDAPDRCARLVDAERLREYRTTLTAAVDDPEVEPEFEAWREYVRERHGDVFERLAADAAENCSSKR